MLFSTYEKMARIPPEVWSLIFSFSLESFDHYKWFDKKTTEINGLILAKKADKTILQEYYKYDGDVKYYRYKYKTFYNKHISERHGYEPSYLKDMRWRSIYPDRIRYFMRLKWYYKKIVTNLEKAKSEHWYICSRLCRTYDSHNVTVHRIEEPYYRQRYEIHTYYYDKWFGYVG
jgi:hypothetical protein